MRERNHIVRVHLNDRELAHLEKCLSKTHWGKEAFPSPLDPTHPRSPDELSQSAVRYAGARRM